MADVPEGRLDTTTLRLLARRGQSHYLVSEERYQPSHRSPRRLELVLKSTVYPSVVEGARLDIRWFDTNDYSIHYLELSQDDTVGYQCRWDRHPKVGVSRSHFHPPPDAGDAIPSSLMSHHPLDVLFTVLDWIDERISTIT